MRRAFSLLAPIFLTLTLAFFTSCSKNDDSNYILSELDMVMVEYIDANYPGAEILKARRERDLIKVEIFQQQKERLVIFSAIDYQWVYSEWDIDISELPDAVVTAVAMTTYAIYPISNIDFVKIPILEYYYIELMQGKEPVYLYITPFGEIL